MSPEVLETIGIFLSGASSILSAFGAIHYERKRGDKVCAERLEALREGIRLGKDAA